MQFALINGKRESAIKGTFGICELCKQTVIAKCGNRTIHHWAHVPSKNCDPWWENETQWHRTWKNEFPEQCREVVRLSDSGEIHRADVITQSNIVIEFQHSAISDEELQSREYFYHNLIWVVDGISFKKNFDLFHPLPAPNSELAKDLVWFKATRETREGAGKGIFYRKSENPDGQLNAEAMVRIRGFDLIKEDVNQSYEGHHQYDWIKARKGWLNRTCPVYIDFGDTYLLRLESYDQYNLPCVRLISKRKFIHDVQTETNHRNVASRFYPINS